MIETGSTFYFAPQDDIQSVILGAATAETAELCMGMYGFHLPALRDIFLANHQKGLAQLLLLDASQAAGKYEHADVVMLINAGIDIVIGTSPLHQILHSKYLLCKSQATVLTGSYNFSLTAAKQDNTLQVFQGQEVWQEFRNHFENARQWVIDNEPQKQIQKALKAGASLKALGVTPPPRFAV